jgi:hypothetical protein
MVLNGKYIPNPGSEDGCYGRRGVRKSVKREEDMKK